MTATGHHINWLPLGLALLLALLGTWLNHVGVRVETVDNAGFTHDPDYIVEHFDALAFDIEGKPHQRLTAARMLHFMDDDTTVLDMPHLRLFDPRTPVSVTAKRALLSADGRQVYFLDQVHAERPSGNGLPTLTLDTEYLHVSSDARIMRTNKPVTLRQGRSNLSANGLVADDRFKQLSMEGNVRGVYEHAR
jgi:lipopolysaccharide export system protein LptC